VLSSYDWTWDDEFRDALVSERSFGLNGSAMADTSIRQIIADSKFFSRLDAESLDFLAAHAELRKLAEGKVLFHYGDRATQFFLVVKGHLSLEIAAIEGPALQLQDLGPGQIAGWSWLISPNRWNFQARARTPIEYVEFDGTAVYAECENNPKFGYELLKLFSTLMSERLQFARQKMMQEWKPLGFA
jgi:CRP/FNR family cyclic AMP-dependent transcriptional regulator